MFAIYHATYCMLLEFINKIERERSQRERDGDRMNTCRTVVHDTTSTAARRHKQPKIHSLWMSICGLSDLCSIGLEGIWRKLMAMAPLKHNKVPSTFALV